jgi:hypothetical protein
MIADFEERLRKTPAASAEAPAHPAPAAIPPALPEGTLAFQDGVWPAAGTRARGTRRSRRGIRTTRTGDRAGSRRTETRREAAERTPTRSSGGTSPRWRPEGS